MDLVEVNDIHAKPSQACLTFAADGFRAQRVADFASLIPNHPAFGEDIGPLASPIAQRPRYNSFGMAKPVNRRGVDPVNAELQRPMNGRD